MDNLGEFEVTARYACHPCTVRRGDDGPDTKPVEYLVVDDTRDYAERPLHGHYTDFGGSDFTHPGAPAAQPTPREEESL